MDMQGLRVPVNTLYKWCPCVMVCATHLHNTLKWLEARPTFASHALTTNNTLDLIHPNCTVCTHLQGAAAVATMLTWTAAAVLALASCACAGDNDFVAGNDDSSNGFFIAYVSVLRCPFPST
jgi:hypothetical protein